MTAPEWPPRDWRALLALVASIAGAATLTGLAAWLVWILWSGGWSIGSEAARIDALAQALMIVLAIVGIVLVSLGLAINRRTVEAAFGPASFKATGGDDPQESET